jgi:hypothetical protein
LEFIGVADCGGIEAVHAPELKPVGIRTRICRLSIRLRPDWKSSFISSMSWLGKRLPWVILLSCLLFEAGCQSYGSADWQKRVGSYTMDDAVKELGPPDRQASTSDGFTVAQWLVAHSRVYSRNPGMAGWGFYGSDISSTPDLYLQLTFSKEGRLTSWKRLQK